jgi:hypothetical protein
VTWMCEADERHLVEHAAAMEGWLSGGYVDGGGERGGGRYTAAMQRLVAARLFRTGVRDRRPTYELTGRGRQWLAEADS